MEVGEVGAALPPREACPLPEAALKSPQLKSANILEGEMKMKFSSMHRMVKDGPEERVYADGNNFQFPLSS